jgi:hypothetical protein
MRNITITPQNPAARNHQGEYKANMVSFPNGRGPEANTWRYHSDFLVSPIASGREAFAGEGDSVLRIHPTRRRTDAQD